MEITAVIFFFRVPWDRLQSNNNDKNYTSLLTRMHRAYLVSFKSKRSKSIQYFKLTRGASHTLDNNIFEDAAPPRFNQTVCVIFCRLKTKIHVSTLVRESGSLENNHTPAFTGFHNSFSFISKRVAKLFVHFEVYILDGKSPFDPRAKVHRENLNWSLVAIGGFHLHATKN